MSRIGWRRDFCARRICLWESLPGGGNEIDMVVVCSNHVRRNSDRDEVCKVIVALERSFGGLIVPIWVNLELINQSFCCSWIKLLFNSSVDSLSGERING
jgi:hypothetical protein